MRAPAVAIAIGLGVSVTTWIAAADDDDGVERAPVDVPDAPTGIAALDRTRARPVGYDHAGHDRAVVVDGGDSIACVTCHPTGKRGELAPGPDHRACFGACHGPAPVRRGARVDVGARAKVCAACHAPTELIKVHNGSWARPRVAYPPFTIEADHGMALGHATHAATPCVTCHPAQVRAPRPTPHRRCRGCHDGTAARPAMTACAACHVLGFGAAVVPRMLVPDLRAGLAHADHARVAPRAECTACHGTIAATEGLALPRPRAADCAAPGCHDGGNAFGVTVACTRCHAAPPTDPWTVARPHARFSHDHHVERIGATACTSCHRLDRRGEATPTGHSACDAAACHAADFGAREPITCAACHLGTEPWRVLAVEPTPLDATEHGTSLAHDVHPQPCAACHQLAIGDRELRPPRGHTACAAAGCHRADAGPSPHLDECTGCHQLGLAEARRQTRIAATWSVRARFVHAPHAALDCVACHDGVAASGAVAEVPTPAKARCVGCHDGRLAFKITGTGCARCHGKPPSP